jgi:uncharacterized protein (DUF736 family)
MFIRNYFCKLNTIQYAYLNRPMLVAAGLALVLVGCSSPESSVFSNSAESILEGRIATVKGACSLDSVAKKGAMDGTYRAKAGSEALFSGWAWEKVRNAPSDYVAVRLTNALTGLPTYAYTSSRAVRADVAAVMQTSPESKVAFELDAKKLPVQAGLYRVELLQVWANEIAICNLPVMLVLE